MTIGRVRRDMHTPTPIAVQHGRTPSVVCPRALLLVPRVGFPGDVRVRTQLLAGKGTGLVIRTADQLGIGTRPESEVAIIAARPRA